MKIGEIVYSIAGRDKGNYFVVTECVDDVFVKISDGKLRRSDNPKLKKIKHLEGTNTVIDTIAEKLSAGISITNPEIRRVLREFGSEVNIFSYQD